MGQRAAGIAEFAPIPSTNESTLPTLKRSGHQAFMTERRTGLGALPLDQDLTRRAGPLHFTRQTGKSRLNIEWGRANDFHEPRKPCLRPTTGLGRSAGRRHAAGDRPTRIPLVLPLVMDGR